MIYKLRKMAIKPTLWCTANCDGCVSRQAYHNSIKRREMLSIEQWSQILKDTAEAGLERMSISGGEPTLYPHLIDLIKEAKMNNITVQVNTNGSLITHELAGKLLEAGLDSVMISIYSHEAAKHDAFRRHKGLWDKATNAARIFSELRKQYPHFILKTQTILLRENYRHLHELLELHQSLGSCTSQVSYLEGDFSKKHLMNVNEILYFKNRVVPKLVDFCSTLDPSLVPISTNAVKNIMSDKAGTPDDLAQGIYWKKNSCIIPQYFTIILANGDVHPCNVVEYTHEPIMGNLFENSFKDIWRSEKWNRFRAGLFDTCKLCPMNIHAQIPLRPEAIAAPNKLPRVRT